MMKTTTMPQGAARMARVEIEIEQHADEYMSPYLCVGASAFKRYA